MKVILGIFMIVVGILAGLYIDVYLLITGIIDIIHGTDILWAIVKIAFREVVGGVVALGFIATGIYLFTKSNK